MCVFACACMCVCMGVHVCACCVHAVCMVCACVRMLCYKFSLCVSLFLSFKIYFRFFRFFPFLSFLAFVCFPFCAPPPSSLSLCPIPTHLKRVGVGSNRSMSAGSSLPLPMLLLSVTSITSLGGRDAAMRTQDTRTTHVTCGQHRNHAAQSPHSTRDMAQTNTATDTRSARRICTRR